MNRNDTESSLEVFLQTLPNRDKAVFLKEIVFGFTTTETALSLDLNESEVSIVERRLIAKLQEMAI